jgi:hypothetical protein
VRLMRARATPRWSAAVVVGVATLALVSGYSRPAAAAVRDVARVAVTATHGAHVSGLPADGIAKSRSHVVGADAATLPASLVVVLLVAALAVARARRPRGTVIADARSRAPPAGR